MGYSMLLATKSYNAGAELVRETLEDDLLATMLISLTKLSLKATILISEQVGLLGSFLAQETSSRIQATALKCMQSIVEKAACFLPNSAFPYTNLFRMLDESTMPSALCDEVLGILLKMVAYGMPDILLSDFNLFMKLLRYVEDAIHSPIFSARFLAFRILVCISNKLKGRDELLLVANPAAFLSGVVSTICDQIASSVRLLPGGASGSEIVQELRSLLKLLLLLAENHSELNFFILDKIHVIIKNMENLQDKPSSAIQIKVHNVVIPAGNRHFSIDEVMLCIFRFLVAFLETVDGAVSSINEIVNKLKQLVSVVCNNSLFDCSTHTLFSLLLHSLVNSDLLPSESYATNSVQGLSGSCNLLESEVIIYECAKNMLEGGDNWRAYKYGSYAACEGEWSIASFMFQRLEPRVQSDINCQWLKFLVQFSCTEKNVKLLFQQVLCCLPLDHSVVQSDGHICPIGSISNEYIGKLVDTISDFSSSGMVLDSLSLQKQNFCFQRWFLALRVKVLLVLADILKLLNGCLVFEDGRPVVQKIKGMRSSLACLSARLASVVEEYDLISTSFVDLDTKSLKVISTLGFSCSVLSFCVEFTYLNANLLIPDNLIKESGYQQNRIVKDFASRLWHTDSEMCFDLMTFLKEFHGHEKALPFQFGFHIPKVGILSKDILTLCRYSVRQLIRLQNKCSNVNNEDTLCQVYKNNMQLLSNIVGAWMHIPFRVPKSFFRVRPTVGCLLMSVSSGSRKQDKIFVSRGSHLALNLCIQLKNVTSNIHTRISKIHCILSCRTLFLGTRRDEQSRGGKGWIDYQASETNTMIDLNKKLQCQVMRQTKEFMHCEDHQIDADLVETSVCFETYGRAQGFSTCILDVSAFSVGSYRIQWLSGAVDHQGTYWTFLPLNACPEFSVIE